MFIFCFLGFVCRYCLWVLGNAATLVKSGSNWKQLVIDSKARGCFFDVKKEYSLTQAIVSATIDFGQIETFLSMDSPLFKTAKWKVCCFILLIMDVKFLSWIQFCLLKNNLKALS